MSIYEWLISLEWARPSIGNIVRCEALKYKYVQIPNFLLELSMRSDRGLFEPSAGLLFSVQIVLQFWMEYVQKCAGFDSFHRLCWFRCLRYSAYWRCKTSQNYGISYNRIIIIKQRVQINFCWTSTLVQIKRSLKYKIVK